MKNVRILFSKTDTAKYISHLDLNRTMTRALRRAAIPLWYTEGFNRHPYITFPAPLSLGFEGLSEVMDFRLEEDMLPQEVITRLNAVLPAGLHVTEMFEPQCKAGDLRAAAYQINLSCPMATVQALLDQPAILVEKRTKKKELKTIDIRPAFADATVTASKNGGCIVEVVLPCGSDANINPQLLLTALRLMTGQEVRYHILRRALFADGGKPFR